MLTSSVLSSSSSNRSSTSSMHRSSSGTSNGPTGHRKLEDGLVVPEHVKEILNLADVKNN